MILIREGADENNNHSLLIYTLDFKTNRFLKTLQLTITSTKDNTKLIHTASMSLGTIRLINQ